MFDGLNGLGKVILAGGASDPMTLGRPTFRTAGGAEFERQKFRRRSPGREEAFVVPDPWPVPVQEQLVNA